MKRVVVTGIGALTPIGKNVDEFWQNAVAGKSGAGTITRFDASQFRTRIACEIHGFDPKDHFDRNEIKRTDLYTQYAYVASDEALKLSGLEIDKMNPFDIGVIWGTGQGGLSTFEDAVTTHAQGNGKPRYNPFLIPKMLPNMAGGMIALRHGLQGLNYTAISACATSNTVLMEAFNHIRLGTCKVVVTGGSEAPISPASIGGFAAMKAMSTRNDDPEAASRPFDVDRDGFVMAEGSGCIILEDYDHAVARGATIYAEMAGAAMTTDAYHMTSTHPEGLGATECMKRSLDVAGLNAGDVDYLNAHATSTGVGDISEVKAAHRFFGPDSKVKIAGSKSMTGHLLGAAGAVEGILSIKSIQDGVIPPTINTETIDPEFPKMNIVIGSAVETDVRVAMSNTFGFGGHNATVVFKKFE
ncbi:MAG: beta-ketoacyl-ACP synthase II [Verrucomicrobiales bacterium]|nr:beta-ketoacyl-ACP synthase II [Verrucomicrobiales bacterium]